VNGKGNSIQFSALLPQVHLQTPKEPMPGSKMCFEATTLIVFSVTCIIVWMAIFWGVCWVTLNINNFTTSVTSWHLVSSELPNILACVCSLCYEMCVYVIHTFTTWLKSVHLALVLWTNIPFAYLNVDKWHLPLVCSSCILSCETINPIIPTCYIECHHVNKNSLHKSTRVDE